MCVHVQVCRCVIYIVQVLHMCVHTYMCMHVSQCACVIKFIYVFVNGEGFD